MLDPILYNLTIKIENASETNFLKSVEELFFHEVINQGIIKEIQLNRIILEEQDGDSTYAIHFVFPNKELFEKEKLTVLGLFLNLMDKEFKGKYVYFGTMMEVVHCYSKT